MRIRRKELKIKVLVIGDDEVGKSSFMTRINSNEFEICKNETIGLQKTTKRFFFTDENREIDIDFYDSEKCLKYSKLSHYFYENAGGYF